MLLSHNISCIISRKGAPLGGVRLTSDNEVGALAVLLSGAGERRARVPAVVGLVDVRDDDGAVRLAGLVPSLDF